LSAPLFNLVPALVLIASLVAPVSSALLFWAAITEMAMLVWWIYLYASIGESPFYSLLSPLGALMVFYIFLRAALRGQRVLWKGRQYVSQ
jgi:hypothetical protein